MKTISYINSTANWVTVARVLTVSAASPPTAAATGRHGAQRPLTAAGASSHPSARHSRRAPATHPAPTLALSVGAGACARRVERGALPYRE